MGFLQQIALWWAGEDSKEDHLWPGLVPSDQVLAQSKWPTITDLYEYRLLMLAYDCFYNCFSVQLWSCLRNMSATITCEGNWPFCYQNQTPKFFASPLVTKPYLYGILLTIIRVQSQAKAYLKIFLNAELHANRLIYRYVMYFLK